MRTFLRQGRERMGRKMKANVRFLALFAFASNLQFKVNGNNAAQFGNARKSCSWHFKRFKKFRNAAKRITPKARGGV